MKVTRWVPAVVLIWLAVYLTAMLGTLAPIDVLLSQLRGFVAQMIGLDGSVLGTLDTAPSLIVAVGVGLILLTMGGVSLRAVLVGGIGISLLMEALAFILQVQTGQVFGTALIHLANGFYGVLALTRELYWQRGEANEVALERDAMRGMLNRVIADNFDGVVIIDGLGKVVIASRMAEEILGGDRTLVGRTSSDVLPPAMQEAVRRAFVAATDGEQARPAPQELVVPRLNGADLIIEYTATRSDLSARDSVSQSVVKQVVCVTFRNVTERRQHEHHLTFVANHDPLTGALTRLRLVQLVRRAMSDETTRAAGLTMLIIELSRFKRVNGTIGHIGGDVVLRQVIGRLREAEVDNVTRLGGDSFAVTLAGVLPPATVSSKCRGIVEALSEPYLIGEHRATIGARIGVTTSALSGCEAETLLRHADMALAAAKASPVTSFALFTPEMDARLKQRQQMDLALRHAIGTSGLTMSYQRQVNLETGELIGVEALLRWSDKTLGVVTPSVFIPAAEESGLIVELGRWVLDTACRDAAQWPEAVALSVNVSPIQLELSDIVADVRQALDASGLSAARLTVEITEGIFLTYTPLIESSLRGLKEMGVSIALDDFGTGYSSLSYLSRLPVDKIKIDKSFVSCLPGDAEAGAIVRAVMTLSDTLGKLVIAEGIETADQAWMLRMMGCQVGQGYYFGKPMTTEDTHAMLAGPSLAAVSR